MSHDLVHTVFVMADVAATVCLGIVLFSVLDQLREVTRELREMRRTVERPPSQMSGWRVVYPHDEEVELSEHRPHDDDRPGASA